MRIVLSGGGTGGHVYPALSVMEEVLREVPDAEFLYIGTTAGLEQAIVSKAFPDLRFESVEISGFRRKLSLDNIRTVVRFVKAVNRAKEILREFRPDIVVGTGGYVCGPVVYAAARLGIRTIIHEQNVLPGLTNKFLSRYASSVAVSFKGSEKNFSSAKRVIYTGNPRATTAVYADAATGLRSLGLTKGAKLVVVVGGSRGARALNQAMIEMAPLIARQPDVHFVYITGEPYYAHTREEIEAQAGGSLPARLQIVPYIHNMLEVLAATSLIVSRAGASFLSEITALGVPSVLIPSPNVTNNHQEANARWLEKEEAAVVLLEQELTGDKLFTQVKAIVGDSSRRKRMAERARRLGESEAAVLFYNELMLQASKNK